MDYVIIHSTLVLRSCWCCLHGDGTHAPHTHTHRFLHALWWWWNRHFRPDAHTSYVCLGKIEWRWWLFFFLWFFVIKILFLLWCAGSINVKWHCHPQGMRAYLARIIQNGWPVNGEIDVANKYLERKGSSGRAVLYTLTREVRWSELTQCSTVIILY